MYFAALKRMIASVEEKLFYDVSLLFLQSLGYREISIVDGSGDGGRDVVSSRKDLRIQLSVRRDWETKINQEADLTLQAGARHFVYITNRVISPEAEADFIVNRYKLAGQVDVRIYDLNSISTKLAHSNIISKAYGVLGANPESDLQPTPREVALSSVLLFGVEAKSLRDDIVEANLCATLFDSVSVVSENDLIDQVANALPGVNVDRSAQAAISRLRAKGLISGAQDALKLSEAHVEKLQRAREGFSHALAEDVSQIRAVTSLSELDARQLLAKARNLLVRGKSLDGNGAAEDDFRSFMANKKLGKVKSDLYECLAAASTIRQFQFGATVDQIFSTNTFDIFRALGGKADVKIVLDSNVALPLMLGLEFKARNSRYGSAVSALDDVCKAHGIGLMAPSVYVNEMAGHGRKALEYLEIYPVLPDEAKHFLLNSRNAYLSHFSNLENHNNIKLEDFLAHFGIVAGSSIRKIENRIISILESHGIKTGFSEWYDQRVRDEVEAQKPNDLKIVVDHDSAVATNLINDSSKGYILATWDRVMVDVVQDIARVYADNPARINDYLSAVEGEIENDGRSEDLLYTLLHMDEKSSQKLAEKIEAINSVEDAYKFRRFVEEARRSSQNERVTEENMLDFFS